VSSEYSHCGGFDLWPQHFLEAVAGRHIGLVAKDVGREFSDVHQIEQVEPASLVVDEKVNV
jgi:hypothetical protein